MRPAEQFFRGVIREPDGSGEKIVVGKATKALAERMATTEAKRLNWDWFVEHCRVDGDGVDVLLGPGGDVARGAAVDRDFVDVALAADRAAQLHGVDLGQRSGGQVGDHVGGDRRRRDVGAGIERQRRGVGHRAARRVGADGQPAVLHEGGDADRRGYRLRRHLHSLVAHHASVINRHLNIWKGS